MFPYSFIRAEKKHLELLERWLKEAEVTKWYKDPDYIEDLENGLTDSRIEMLIVFFKDLPFAFIQNYDIHSWTDHHLSYLPKGSRGIDTFIGEPGMIGQGHGTKYLEYCVSSLFSSKIPALGIDPSVNNLRAISVYRKIGFIKDELALTEYGKLQLMSLINTQN